MVEFSYVIVFVSDMARSVAFYRDVLGLPLEFESPKWTEFETPGTTVALHIADAPPGTAIAVGAISVLTKRKSFWFGSLGFGVVGVVLLLVGMLATIWRPASP